MSLHPSRLYQEVMEDPFMTASEVAVEFRVDSKVIGRWADVGKFKRGTWFRTPGQQLRVRTSEVKRALKEAAEKDYSGQETPPMRNEAKRAKVGAR